MTDCDLYSYQAEQVKRKSYLAMELLVHKYDEVIDFMAAKTNCFYEYKFIDIILVQ